MTESSLTITTAASGLWQRSARADLIAVLAIAVIAALLFLLFPSNLALLTRAVALMLLVMSLDLVTGYAGVTTLGHATVFGTGAYAAGIAAVHFGITDPVAMLCIGAISGALTGGISSLVILRGHSLSQLVLSIAIVQLTHELVSKLSAWTGGSDGLSGIVASPLLGLFRFDLRGHTAYSLAVVLLIVIFVVLRMIVRSPLGMLCRGIRQDPVRVKAMGAPVYFTLVKMYVIAGAVAGLGGALSAIATKVVGLDSLTFDLSAEALVMLVLGGVGNLFGAMAGTLVFVGLEDRISAINPFHWLTIIGMLLVLVVLFAPKGLSGAAEMIWSRLHRRLS